MSGGLHISSLLLRAAPARIDDVTAAITALGAAEIAVSDASGKIVVTLETDSEDEIIATMSAMQHLEGVVSVALVFHHTEGGPIEDAAATAGATP